MKEHWEYGRWMVAASLAYWVSGGAYYVLAGMLLRMEDVAALSALQTVLAPASQFLTATTLLVLPWAAARFADEGGPALQTAVRRITFLCTAAATGYLIFLTIFGKWMMGAFYGGKYSPYAHLLPLAALPMLMTAVAQGPAIALRAMQAPSEIFVGYSVGGALTVLTGWALTHYWGLAGAMVGLCISGLAFAITTTLLYRKRLKPHLDLQPAAGLSSNGKGTRVAWLMPSLDRGFYMQPLFREFTQLFPETVIFTGLWPGTLAGYEGTFTVRHLRGVKFIRLRQAEMAHDGAFAWVPLSALYELLRFRPRVVFTTGFSLFTLYALLLKLLLRCRLILLWDGISPSIADLNSPLRLGMRRLMARFFNACVSNTREGLDYLRRTLDVSERKLGCHPYQVPDITLLGSSSQGSGKRDTFARPVFLYVGRLIEPKGLRNLMHACSLLKEQGKTHFSVVIAGEGAAGETFRQLANSLGLEGQVHWVGQVDYEKLGSYYRACDVFVFPTHEDVWGLVVPEAMAFGKPILCSKYAGSKELIVEGANGYIFDPRQPRELAELMAKFINEPGLAEGFGAKSKLIISPYTPRQAANVLAAAVSKVLDGKH